MVGKNILSFLGSNLEMTADPTTPYEHLGNNDAAMSKREKIQEVLTTNYNMPKQFLDSILDGSTEAPTQQQNSGYKMYQRQSIALGNTTTASPQLNMTDIEQTKLKKTGSMIVAGSNSRRADDYSMAQSQVASTKYYDHSTGQQNSWVVAMGDRD